MCSNKGGRAFGVKSVTQIISPAHEEV
jgi:hypothetical protein